MGKPARNSLAICVEGADGVTDSGYAEKVAKGSVTTENFVTALSKGGIQAGDHWRSDANALSSKEGRAFGHR